MPQSRQSCLPLPQELALMTPLRYKAVEQKTL